MSRVLFAACAALALSGCNSLIASTSSKPIGSEQGTRTLAMRIEDNSIEHTAGVNIYRVNPKFREANVNIISFYSSVLLAGQVPSEEMKAQAEKVVYDIAEVKQIHNELTVSTASAGGERMSDGFISTRVRSRLNGQPGYPSARSRVFTVGGTVYLMGKLTPAEADAAVTLIKDVSGVKRIVKLVDYLQAPAASSAPATPAS